ncbi:MAG: chemotaxis protein CheW [Syntrophobacteraceae bacterium]
MTASDEMEASQYLTFKLAGEVFGLGISRVREVLDYTPVTRIPEAPDFMLGVINLRGNVVPVLDMRLKFGMASNEKKANTCIIIVEIELEGETILLGALADSVQAVLEIGPDQMEPPPRMGAGLKSKFIKAMGKHEGGFLIILDIDKVFSTEELAMTQEPAQALAAAS